MVPERMRMKVGDLTPQEELGVPMFPEEGLLVLLSS